MFLVLDQRLVVVLANEVLDDDVGLLHAGLCRGDRLAAIRHRDRDM